MNERINELYTQVCIEQKLPFTVEYNSAVMLDAFANKFAELLVKECASIVDKIVPPGYEDYPDYRDQIEQSFRTECAAKIKQHFGVE